MIEGTFKPRFCRVFHVCNRGLMKKFVLVSPLLFLLLSCGGKKVSTNAPTNEIYEPDRVLFDRAMRDLKKNKFKDYITFFPTSDLADDAQMKIAMTHVRRIEKHDRDNTQARLAEVELKSMLETYPDSDLLDEAKTALRAVQEVLADGVNGVGNFYMLHRNYAAAVSRYKEIATKYPDYSKMPDTLFGLAEALRRAGNEPEAAIYYARIVVEHPVSDRVNEAKRHLAALNQPIPEPNPVALARAQQATHDDKSILGKMFGMFKSRPSVPTETSARSSADDDGAAAETGAPGPVRGGTTGTAGAGSGNTNGDTNFNINPKVIDKSATPTKKFR